MIDLMSQRNFVNRLDPDQRVQVVGIETNLWPGSGRVVEYSAMGGGILYFMPEGEFEALFEPFVAFPPYTRGRVQIEDGPVYRCWLNGKRWNGWRCPAFERDVMLAMVADPDLGLSLDGDVVVCDYHDGNEPERWGPEVIATVEGDKVVWPIGSGYWIWQEAESVPLFAVFKTGVFRHECGGIFSSQALAEVAAERLIKTEPDNWHDYRVVPFEMDEVNPLLLAQKGIQRDLEPLPVAKFVRRNGVVSKEEV